jgi:hypothetical protein
VSRSLVVLLALAVGACGSWEATKEPPVIKLPQQDLYCEIAEKVQWDIKDTPETIRQNVRENRKYDKVCASSGAAQKVAQK